MTTKNNTLEIEHIKFKDLVINPIYSGRSEKEIKANAKEKQAELTAAGGWNPTMPGQYFIGEDGKKCLLAGFSRVEASKLNGEDAGYFVRAVGDEVSYLLACETSNSVKPLSPLSRGARYSELCEGVLAEGFEGEKADPKDVTHWTRMPMTQADVAQRIGKTAAWVSKCIAIFKAPPEVRDLLESDKISVQVAEGARSIADKHNKGSDAKVIAICRAAFSKARGEGKDTATKKHFDAIKADFIPDKKLVADGKDSKDTPSAADNKPKEGSETKSKGDTAPEDKKDNAVELELPGGDNEAENLFQQQTAEVLKEGSKKNEKLKKALATFFSDTEGLGKLDVDITLTEEEADILAEEVLKIITNAAQVF